MKTVFTIILFALFSIGVHAQSNKGMIKVSVMYPNAEGKSFDMDYDLTKHLPMVSGLLGDALISASAEKGLGGAEPGTLATYKAAGTMYFSSLEDFQSASDPNAEKIMGDLANFTDIKPVMPVSEVML